VTAAPRRPRLTTVTISWNPGPEFDRFLAAMAKARECVRHIEIETIVIDNGSRDDTPDRLARDFPWIRLIRNDRNLGFAPACNQGLEAGTGDYLMLLNPDCFANARALDGMVRYLERHPRVGAVGCMLLHGDGLPQRSAHSEPSPLSFLLANSMLSPVFERVTKLSYHHRVLVRKRPFACDWLMGSCIMVPRAVYAKVGGLAAEYFIYSEDTDWCRRIRRAGWRVMHLPNLRMVHLHKQSAARRPEFFFRRLYRSLLLYANRNMAPPERRAFIRAVLLDLHARRPVYRLIAALKPERREALAARIDSCTRLIEIFRSGDPDLYDDPPPQR
jgi:GT2 family glycosyltransferase